jgi:putative ABC transport system ATP-binding protein
MVPEQAADATARDVQVPDAKIVVEHISYSLPPAAVRVRSAWPWRWPWRSALGDGDEVQRLAAPHLILDDVSFAVKPGHVFTVLGPSGSGKSTLLRAIDRLIEPTSGRVLLDGRPAADLPVQQLRRRVGMVFQTAALFDGTVMDNVLYGPRLRANDERAPDDARAGRSSRSDRDAAHDQASGLLRRVGLPDSFCDKPVDELSGGEAQRVSLARALANEPEVLLLDEPTAALDPSASLLIEDLLEQLSGETDLTFIFVTHNLPQARRIGDHGLLLADGRVVDAGPLPAFLDNPSSDLTRHFVAGTLHEETS